MKLDNSIISIEIANHGAELKSAVKDGFEYMWCADEKYWARTSPVLFPIVGSLKDNLYKLDGKVYPMNQHGFARDNEFELIEHDNTSATYLFKDNEETLKKYPFKFELIIKYTLINNIIKIEWTVKNKNDKVMSFSIGAHPAFNLKEGDNFFKFDTNNNIVYNLLDENGLLDKNSVHTLENDGYVKITDDMFDNDALIIENRQAKEVTICDKNKSAYLKVVFDTELFGLWSPAKKRAPFVCIEPWYGRCDRNDFDGELTKKDYIINISPGEEFNASYKIELL
ncbi:MAG: aldose 1-epimerase family protein [Ruminococcaceae bacterium]|nr:aldose 1-epimerase family protein [Oscillospiraceae bacterium]